MTLWTIKSIRYYCFCILLFFSWNNNNSNNSRYSMAQEQLVQPVASSGTLYMNNIIINDNYKNDKYIGLYQLITLYDKELKTNITIPDNNNNTESFRMNISKTYDNGSVVTIMDDNNNTNNAKGDESITYYTMSITIGNTINVKMILSYNDMSPTTTTTTDVKVTMVDDFVSFLGPVRSTKLLPNPELYQIEQSVMKIISEQSSGAYTIIRYDYTNTNKLIIENTKGKMEFIKVNSTTTTNTTTTTTTNSAAAVSSNINTTTTTINNNNNANTVKRSMCFRLRRKYCNTTVISTNNGINP